MGVADTAGTLEFFLHPTNFGGSSFVNKFGNRIVPTMEVKCLPLMHILSNNSIDSIGIMKIDIEGFEFKVLDAFFQCAPRSLHPKFVITEYHEHLVNQAGGDVLELLSSQFYEIEFSNKLNYFLKKSDLSAERSALIGA